MKDAFNLAQNPLIAACIRPQFVEFSASRLCAPRVGISRNAAAATAFWLALRAGGL
jgi:hypothetical protein